MILIIYRFIIVGACRLARLAIHIGTPVVRLLCFLCGGVSVCLPNVLPCFPFGLLLFNNEWTRVLYSLHYKRIQIPFPVCSFVGWFGWLLPVVLSHRHTAKSFSFAVVTCQVYPVHAERRTADPIDHYCTATAVVYYCAGRTLNPIGLLCLSRGRRHRHCCVDALQVIRSSVCGLFLLTMQIYNVFYIYTKQKYDFLLKIKIYLYLLRFICYICKVEFTK